MVILFFVLIYNSYRMERDENNNANYASELLKQRRKKKKSKKPKYSFFAKIILSE